MDDIVVDWPWSRAKLSTFTDRVAVTWPSPGASGGAESITYEQLVRIADRIAAVISRSSSNVAPTPVPIGTCLDNGLCIVACQLGALWAGHSFVPLSIEPSAIKLMKGLLQGCPLVFCPPALQAAVMAVAATCDHHVTVYPLDDADLLADLLSPSAAGRPDAAEDAAKDAAEDAHRAGHCVRRFRGAHRFCTFHTSGTTGEPKAVHSSYSEWNAYVTATAKPYRLTADSRAFVGTSNIFDPSAGLAFAALAQGAAVCVAPFAETLGRLRECIALTRATHACSTPAVWALFDTARDDGALARSAQESSATEIGARPERDCSALETVMLGGEPMPPALVREWLRRGVTLINTYGTTEATVYQFAYGGRRARHDVPLIAC